ncbi:hypothetical protein ACFY5F_02785 [Streptomyces sp. NPDC013161]|uniref:hypothetical protein n=1 Tax=Streptomyces sp. NPDC013161 TaxID=3364862 RepID=UPI0036C12AC6
MRPALDDLAQLAGLPDPFAAGSGKQVDLGQQQRNLPLVEVRVPIPLVGSTSTTFRERGVDDRVIRLWR